MRNPVSHIHVNLPRAAFVLQVDLYLPTSGITVLLGPSGSGKTSLLRCVAGLERAGTCRVEIAGQVWEDSEFHIFVPTWRRPLGYVFQEACLFEHLTVRGNVEYGLRRSKGGSSRQTLDAVIQMLGIEPLLTRRAQQLSGGERQRVAIARALAAQPLLLLLDEPLAAIDQARRADILPWLERLRDELQLPMLYVTHSTDEAARLADTLVVLEQGHVKAAGPVAEVLTAVHHPVILGDDAGALLRGRIAERDGQWHLAGVACAGGVLWIRDTGLSLGTQVRLRVLARDVSITTAAPLQTSIQNHLRGVIKTIATDTHPAHVLVHVLCGDSTLLSRITNRAAAALRLEPGQAVWAQIKSVAIAE